MTGFTVNKVKCSCYRPSVAQRVGRGIALLFHDRGTRRRWVVSSMPWPHFTPGKDPVPILQEAGWAPGPVWTGGKSRPHQDSILDHPAHSQSLYRLSYLAHRFYSTWYIKSTPWCHEHCYCHSDNDQHNHNQDHQDHDHDDDDDDDDNDDCRHYHYYDHYHYPEGWTDKLSPNVRYLGFDVVSLSKCSVFWPIMAPSTFKGQAAMILQNVGDHLPDNAVL